MLILIFTPHYIAPNPPVPTAPDILHIISPFHCLHQVLDKNHSLFNKHNYEKNCQKKSET